MCGYEWTDEYGIFRLTVDAKIQKEIRPVFRDKLPQIMQTVQKAPR